MNNLSNNIVEVPNNSDIILGLIVPTLSLLLSVIINIIINIQMNKKRLKEERYNEFYCAFYALWQSIHKGRAFDFSHLSRKDRDKIVEFFIEKHKYVPEELEMQVYELKTKSLEEYNSNEDWKDDCDKIYRDLTDYMVKRERKYRKKYTNVKY